MSANRADAFTCVDNNRAAADAQVAAYRAEGMERFRFTPVDEYGHLWIEAWKDGHPADAPPFEPPYVAGSSEGPL